MEHTPAVSCICLTYARPELLEEAVYSFLQQEYPGLKELIVLNDYAEQTLMFDHPEVRVINLPWRFRTVGEKRNYRWSGIGSYHYSGFGASQPGDNRGYHEGGAYIQQRADRGEIRQGRIPLQPCWKTDYRQVVASYIAALAEQPALVQ
ncbi:MAG TPA: hypothetical protein VGD58_07800 [Herpetosiphonaceae bacterium]